MLNQHLIMYLWTRSMLQPLVQPETPKLAMLLGAILLLSSEAYLGISEAKRCWYVSAWGEVVARAAEGEEIVYAEVKFQSAMMALWPFSNLGDLAVRLMWTV